MSRKRKIMTRVGSVTYGIVCRTRWFLWNDSVFERIFSIERKFELLWKVLAMVLHRNHRH